MFARAAYPTGVVDELKLPEASCFATAAARTEATLVALAGVRWHSDMKASDTGFLEAPTRDVSAGLLF
jgi:hypothetical protein